MTERVEEGKNGSKSNKTHEKIDLTRIHGPDNKPTNYCDGKGYLYTKGTAYKNHVYMKCKHSVGKECPARAIMKDNDLKKTMLVRDHNHCPEKKLADRTLFTKTLQRICRENPIAAPLNCYIDAKKELKGKVERKHIPLLSSYQSLIYRSHKLKVPLRPTTIEQFEELIGEAKNSRRYAYDDEGNLLYRGVWQGTTGKNVAFVSERTLQEVLKLENVTLMMDGTFRALPKHLKFQQLYIINVIIRGRCFPLAYLLMERKDFPSYMVVFDNLKKLIPNMNVEECMSDYESATRKAIRQQFPSARLSGCYFHYVQAIYKASKRFALLKYEDTEKFKDAINKIASLALLPNEYIAEGFDCISKKIKNSKRWNRFKAYWVAQWSTANISVYGLKHRTNNFSETLNRTINKLIGNKHPHIWKLILNLQTVEMLKSDELEQAVGGLMGKRYKKETMRFNKKITDATELFDETVDVEQFIDNITFNDELSKIYNLRVCHDEDMDGNDDEIFPNDYNEETEFRKAHQRNVRQPKRQH